MAGLARLRYEQPEVYVVDLMLPALDGWRLIESARAAGIGTPIVVVESARGSEDDRVNTLELGADDYLVKPFSMRELVARVSAAARRGVRSQSTERGQEIQVEELVDRPRQRPGPTWTAVARPDADRVPPPLRPRRAEPAVVTWDELLQQIWGRRLTRRPTVDVFVRKLREKIDAHAPRHMFVHTRYGVGYKLEPQPKTGQDSAPMRGRAAIYVTAGALRAGVAPGHPRRGRGGRRAHELAGARARRRPGCDRAAPDQLVRSLDPRAVAC